jgi:uncharacterized protein YjcR
MKTEKQPHFNRGGAPKGNKNALKHGRYTKDQLESQKFYKSFMKQIHAALKEVEQERFPR